MFIVLAILFCIISITLMVMSRRVTPLPSSWSTFTTLSAVLSVIGHFIPRLTTFWLIVAMIIWIITAVIVVKSKFKVNKARLAITIMVIALVIIAIYAPKVTPQKPVVKATPTVNQAPTMVNLLKDDLKKNGWKEEESQYTIDNIDITKDKSTASDLSFNKKGVRSANELISWFTEDSKAAKKVIAQAIETTGGTLQEVMNPANWFAVQSNVKFKYPGNTGYLNDKVIAAGAKNGDVGDIFLAFISPTTKKVFYVRGGCVNPQTFTPTPNNPEPKPQPKPEDNPKQKLTPKSGDPKDYKKPGDDTTKDSGTGKKPIVPVVTTPAESTPPVVVKQKETEVRGGKVIVDTPTNKPGSETGVTAPGATPVNTTTNSNTSNNSSTPPTNEGGTNDGVVTDD